MHTKLITALAFLPFCLACATETEAPQNEAPSAPAVSEAALGVEQAERILDRGEDAAEAKRLLTEAIASDALTADERGAAILALSRAHEALGETEPAIALLEKELAARRGDPHHAVHLAVRDRLRELLTGSTEKPGPNFVPNDPAPPFAQLLSTFFPPDAEGRVSVRSLIVGGDGGVSEELGTFDVGAGRRARLEAECPLCDMDVNVHSSTSRSDWLAIPAHADELDSAFVAFYYDLQKNRIPARYESFLPMTVAAIEAELDAGRSIIAVTDRPGAPPVVLLAAPRTAMLEDVEKALAAMSELPAEPVVVDVENKLRPKEIQAVIRGDLIKPARQCYEALLERQPDAAGKLALWFEIDGEGALSDHRVTVKEGTLDEPVFVPCVEDALAKLRFPAIGETTTVNYPIALTPN